MLLHNAIGIHVGVHGWGHKHTRTRSKNHAQCTEQVIGNAEARLAVTESGDTFAGSADLEHGDLQTSELLNVADRFGIRETLAVVAFIPLADPLLWKGVRREARPTHVLS